MGVCGTSDGSSILPGNTEMKYIRLLRLPDHYVVIGIIIAAGLQLHLKNFWLLLWCAAVVLLSISVFVLNEIVDREDTDKHSWNNMHIRKNERFDFKIVWSIFGFFSFAGLLLSYMLGVFWWALIAYAFGILYSVKPFRLKARFGLDILAQSIAWTVLPYVAVAWKYHALVSNIPVILDIMAFCWVIIFPYQLADFRADKKAELNSTHTILGMKNSLILGLILLAASGLIFIGFGVYKTALWSLAFLPIGAYLFFKYVSWLKMGLIREQTRSMQNYVMFLKPIGYLFLAYMVIWLAFV